MQSAQPPAARAWYIFSDDIPDSEVVVPIVTSSGNTVLAVRPGEMTPRLMEALNDALRLLIDTGRWRPGDDGAGENPDSQE